MTAHLVPSLCCLAILACAGPASAPAQNDAPFGPGVTIGVLQDPVLREASGIVASYRHRGHYWLHNDSGDEPRLYAIDSTGRLAATLEIAGADHRDWEDIARRADTLFIADIGDNAAVHPEVDVYVVIEPAALANATQTAVRRQRLRYPDGPRDAETLLVDPMTGDWFIVTKRESQVRVYRVSAAMLGDSIVTMERVSDGLPFTRAVGGDVAPDGSEVLIKTYDRVFYWVRHGNESIAAAVSRPPVTLPYAAEPQGEAIGFTMDGSAYLTTTERVGGRPQPIRRYPRLQPPPQP